MLAKTLGFSRGMWYHRFVLDIKDKLLLEKIENIYADLDDTLGHKKLAPLLGTGKNRVRRVMRKNGLKARVRKPGYHYHGKTNLPPAPNLANQEEYADNFDQGIIYSDIFEFKLADYSKVRGCFALLKQTRQILALVFDYSMADTLVTTTIDSIKILATPSQEHYLLWHSDQGKQYGSKHSRDKLLEKGLIQSMSRPGTPTDNPYAERFVSTFKHAIVRREKYFTLGEFIAKAGKWINFYNNQRPHEGVDNLPPNTFARQFGWPVVSNITNLTVLKWVLDMFLAFETVRTWPRGRGSKSKSSKRGKMTSKSKVGIMVRPRYSIPFNIFAETPESLKRE